MLGQLVTECGPIAPIDPKRVPSLIFDLVASDDAPLSPAFSRRRRIWFYDEHVEADSVHENIAAYDLAGGLAGQEPELAGQILFGVRALLWLDGRFAGQLLDSFEADRSSLLKDPVLALR